MNISVRTSPHNAATKLNYDVLIENQPDGTVKATLIGLPECQGSGATKEEALEKLIAIFQARNPEIVTLEIEPPKIEHPWMKFAGMHKDNPVFEEVLKYIEEERNELDNQMDEYYTKINDELDKELKELGIEDLDDFMKLSFIRQRNKSIQANDMESNL